MTRLLIATCALALGLGMPSDVQAQIVYGSSLPSYGGIPAISGFPNGMGLFSPLGSTVFSPFGFQSMTPFGFGSQYTMPGYNGLGTAANAYSPYGSQLFSNLFSPFSFDGRTTAADYSPFGRQGLSSYYTPYGGAFSQTAANMFGGGISRSFGYNPFNGVTYGGPADYVTRPTVVNPALGFGGTGFGSNPFGGYNSAYNNLLARELYRNYLSGYNNLLNQERNNFANTNGSWNNTTKYSGSNSGSRFSNSWSYSTKNSGNFNGAANSLNSRLHSGTYTGSGSGPFGSYNFNLNYSSNNSFHRR